MSATTSDAQVSDNIYRLSGDVAIMLCDERDLPPTVRAELPGGWQATGEVLDFDIGGEWVEGWMLTKQV